MDALSPLVFIFSRVLTTVSVIASQIRAPFLDLETRDAQGDMISRNPRDTRVRAAVSRGAEYENGCTIASDASGGCVGR